MGLSRRDLILAGGGLVAGAGGMLWWGRRGGEDPAPSAPVRPIGGPYGHGVMPPEDLGPLSLESITSPPPADPGPRPVTRRVRMVAVDQRIAVSAAASFDAWTFEGRVPGPVLRATEGDQLEITLENRTAHAHNLHFHGRHEIDADGWEPVPPGGTAVYRLTAGPAGLHPYHCDFTPSEDHIANGLYGLLIVDPARGRSPAREVVLTLGGFDLDGDGTSDLFGWNGVAGFYAKFPIKVPAGDPVRVYLANLVMDQALVSFHLHAETFEVYRSGTGAAPDERTDVVSLGPAERAVLEFRLPRRGRYMFHPHQRLMAEHGAMGWFAAV
jgi:FtsP/CotA-like multicopper oxidase with cupredoxin domain